MTQNWLRAAGAMDARGLALLLAIASPGEPARAAGGPYAVDDSEIGDAGECKLETWASRSDTRNWIVAATPTCTFKALPWVELSATALRQWSSEGSAWFVGPKAKVSLVPIEDFGVGVGAFATWAYNTAERRTANAALAFAFTHKPLPNLRLNLNLGWSYGGADRSHRLAYGAGFEWIMVERLTLIGEVFGRHGERAAFQIGLRPAIIKDRLDLDIAYGRAIDGTNANWITFGTIVKF